MKKIGHISFSIALVVATMSSCGEESDQINESLTLVPSGVYSQDEPAQLFIEHSQVLQVLEYYYFIDQLGYYHFFKEGRPTCPDSTRQAIKAQVVDLAEANNQYSLDEEILWFNNGTLLYGEREESDTDVLSGSPAPFCPEGTYQGDSPRTFSKPVSCNAGTKKKPKMGTMLCSVDTRLCIEYFTGSTDKSTTGQPYDCGSCKKNAKGAEDFGEEVVITPYCW